MLFHRELGLPIVNSSFTYYRDVFLFALAVRWDIDVASFDLVPKQAQAAFSFIELMQRSEHQREFAHRVTSPSGDRLAGSGFAGGVQTNQANPVLPHKYAPTKAHVHAVRKQAGASKWAIRLGKLIEGQMAWTSPWTRRVWGCWMRHKTSGTILKAKEGAQAVLKDKHLQAKEKHKENTHMAKKRAQKGKRASGGRRSCSSTDTSSSSSFSSSGSSMTAAHAVPRPQPLCLPGSTKRRLSQLRKSTSLPLDKGRTPFQAAQHGRSYQLLEATQDAM